MDECGFVKLLSSAIYARIAHNRSRKKFEAKFTPILLCLGRMTSTNVEKDEN